MKDAEEKAGEIDRMFSMIGVSDDRVRRLLMLSVGRVLLKRRGAKIGESVEEYLSILQTTTHIRDWLVVAVADGAKWLSNVDDLGRPKKLMKFSTLEAISLEADRQMERKQRQSGRAVAIVEGEEELVFEVGEGWTIVRLLTPAALDRESRSMQHCIGHGAYDDALQDENVSFYSLRDTQGKPHVTFEVRSGKLAQLQGKQNQPPLEHYLMRCLPYFNAMRVSVYGIPQLFTNKDGAVYSVYNLPDVLESDTNLSIHNHADRPLRLPRSIRTTKSLWITGNAFSNTPDEVSVGDCLHISGTALASTPPSLSVGGSIILNGLENVVLPPDLCVEGNLTLTGSSLSSLPSGLFVRDVLGLDCTNVTELPTDLRCGGINISNTAIRRFDTAVFREDDRINRAAKSLIAKDSGLEEIVGLPHFRSLTVGGSNFRTPDGLVVQGTLMVLGGTVTIAAATKSVGGLYLDNCDADVEIEDVTDSVTIRRSLVRFGKSLRCGGAVEVCNKSKIERAPDRIRCDLFCLNDVTIDSMPTEIIATESVMMSDIGIPRLDGTIKTKALWVHPSTTFFGDGIEAETVTVSSGVSAWYLALPKIKAYLANGGDLNKRPDRATVLYEPEHRGSDKTSRLLDWLTGSIGGAPGLFIGDPREYQSLGFEQTRWGR